MCDVFQWGGCQTPPPEQVLIAARGVCPPAQQVRVAAGGGGPPAQQVRVAAGGVGPPAQEVRCPYLGPPPLEAKCGCPWPCVLLAERALERTLNPRLVLGITPWPLQSAPRARLRGACRCVSTLGAEKNISISKKPLFQRNLAASCDGRALPIRTRDSNQGGPRSS